MKKFVALALSLISILALCSCGKAGNNGETTGAAAATAQNSDEVSQSREPQYDYDLTPYVKLGQYKDLDVEFVDEKVIDTELQQNIDDMLIDNKYCTEKKSDKKTVENGDWVNIDYEGTMAGEKFDGGTARGAELHIGSGSFIEGFESGLVGKAVGSTVTLDLKFPENYSVNPDLSGKPVTFKVKINHIVEKIPNELTNDLVKEITSGTYTEINQFKGFVAERLQNEKINKNKNAVLDKAIENATIIAYPEDEVKSYVELAEKTVREQAEDQSMDLEEYIESQGKTMEAFEAELKDTAEQAIKTELVVFAIAKAENIVIDDERYNLMASSYAGRYGVDQKTIEARIGTGRMMRMIMQNDVVSFLYEHSKNYKPAETTTQQ